MEKNEKIHLTNDINSNIVMDEGKLVERQGHKAASLSMIFGWLVVIMVLLKANDYLNTYKMVELQYKTFL